MEQSCAEQKQGNRRDGDGCERVEHAASIREPAGVSEWVCRLTPTIGAVSWKFDMPETVLSAQFHITTRRELRDAHERIVHAVSQLTDEDIWWRPYEEQNTIGNILLHLCGNMGQWLVSGVGGAPDTRKRPGEFAERTPISKIELLMKLSKVVAAADEAIVRCSESELLRVRNVQHGPQTGMAAIFHSVGHLIGHTQEIIYITRLRLETKYDFRGISATSK